MQICKAKNSLFCGMIWENGKLTGLESSRSLTSSKQEWLYEVLRVQDSCPIFIDEHLNRFFKGISNLNISIPYSQKKIFIGIFELINAIKLINGNIRILLDINNTDLTIAKIDHKYPSNDEIRLGVDTAVLEKERKTPNIKSWNPDVRNSANQLIINKEVYEVLLLNQQGIITEGSRSNIFFIKDNNIFTPPIKQILPGITREIIFRICSANDIHIYETSISFAELDTFEALFLSGTSPGLLPIRKVNQRDFNASHHLIPLLRTYYQSEIKQNIQQTVRKYDQIDKND